MNTRYGAALAALAVAGCAITQEVTPYKLGQPDPELCVVRNSEVVQDGFHDVFVKVLERKGFSVRTLPDKAATDSCPLLTTYEAIYRWDLAIYLARADLRVYDAGGAPATIALVAPSRWFPGAAAISDVPPLRKPVRRRCARLQETNACSAT